MSLKNNKKGFTLIEMVVVIVIIAVLAAILVPSLLAYVNNAQEKKLITAGDTIRKAVLTEVADMAADGVEVNNTSDSSIFDDDFWAGLSDTVDATVAESSSGEDAKYLVEFEIRDNTIYTIVVSDADRSVELTDGVWKIVD